MKDLQREVDRFISSTREGYWEPLAMFAALVEEVGELGRYINAVEGVKSPGEGMEEGLKEEMGDVLFALACLANHYGVNLEEMALKSIEKYNSREK